MCRTLSKNNKLKLLVWQMLLELYRAFQNYIFLYTKVCVGVLQCNHFDFIRESCKRARICLDNKITEQFSLVDKCKKRKEYREKKNSVCKFFTSDRCGT
jgi:hypothetical protein